MRGVVADQVVERLAVGVNLSRLDCVTELRLVASNRLKLFFERVADVDDKSRLHVVFTKRECVQDFQRPVRRNLRLYFLETRHKAGIANQLRDDRVIRMAAVDGVSDDDLRLETPDDYRNLGAILGRVLNAAVRKSEVLADGDAHYFRGLGGFLRPQLRSASTRHLSGSEIEDPGRASDHV